MENISKGKVGIKQPVKEVFIVSRQEMLSESRKVVWKIKRCFGEVFHILSSNQHSRYLLRPLKATEHCNINN